MTSKQFLKYLQNPDLLSESTVIEFEALIKQYPYFQTAHLMYLKNLNLVSQKMASEKLPLETIYVADRKVLYRELRNTAKLKTAKQSEQVQSNLSNSQAPKEEPKNLDVATDEQLQSLHKNIVSDFFDKNSGNSSNINLVTTNVDQNGNIIDKQKTEQLLKEVINNHKNNNSANQQTSQNQEVKQEVEKKEVKSVQPKEEVKPVQPKEEVKPIQPKEEEKQSKVEQVQEQAKAPKNEEEDIFTKINRLRQERANAAKAQANAFKQEADMKAKQEERARREAEEKAKAEEQKRKEAEEKAKAEEQARREAEEKAKAEEQKRKEAEEKAKAEEEARRIAEEKAIAEQDAKEKAQDEAELKAQLAELEKVKQEQGVETEVKTADQEKQKLTRAEILAKARAAKAAKAEEASRLDQDNKESQSDSNAKEQIQTKVQEEVKVEIEQKVEQVKVVQEEVKEEIKEELSKEIQEEILQEIKQEVIKEVKQELKQEEVKQEIPQTKEEPKLEVKLEEPQQELSAADILLAKLNKYKAKKDEQAKAQQEQNSINQSNQNNLIDQFIEKAPHIDRNKEVKEGDLSVDSITPAADLYSEKLAKLYIEQKLYERALGIYNKLIMKYPEKAATFALKIDEINNLINNNK